MIDIHDLSADQVLADSQEEAIAVARVGMAPGDEIVLHDKACAIDADTLEGCTCEPQILTVGEANEA